MKALKEIFFFLIFFIYYKSFAFLLSGIVAYIIPPNQYIIAYSLRLLIAFLLVFSVYHFGRTLLKADKSSLFLRLMWYSLILYIPFLTRLANPAHKKSLDFLIMCVINEYLFSWYIFLKLYYNEKWKAKNTS